MDSHIIKFHFVEMRMTYLMTLTEHQMAHLRFQTIDLWDPKVTMHQIFYFVATIT